MSLHAKSCKETRNKKNILKNNKTMNNKAITYIALNGKKKKKP
jgi:hypothetical protein